MTTGKSDQKSDKKRAATTRLEPGQHSIDRVEAFQRPGRDGWTVHWHLRLPSGKLERDGGRFTQAPTKGQARAKARAIAEDLLKGSGNGIWKGTDPVLDYMDKVTLPKIRSKMNTNASRAAKRDELSPNTVRRYELAYRLLRGECDQQHRHRHALAGLTLREAMKPRALTSCLEEIARLHGAVNAKHAKIVAKKYLAAELRVDEVIEFNPLTDLDVDLSKAKEPAYSRGGQALSRDEFTRALRYLLDADPEDVDRPKRGRWTREQRVTERAACLDIVLSQATTGLRISELCMRPVADCYVDANGTFIFLLGAKDTKTRTGRQVAVLAPEVSERLARRLHSGSPWLFPMPSDPDRLWDPRNRDRKLANVYQELARELDIEMFEHERGHSWRTTSNTLLYDVLPEATRIRLFGHSKAVNRQKYTAVTSTDAIVAAASPLYEA
ncbi:MAG: hypothetical protein L0G85_00180 [Kocuria sp.]|nr:hypothetical protein [Kocuria sp.]